MATFADVCVTIMTLFAIVQALSGRNSSTTTSGGSTTTSGGSTTTSGFSATTSGGSNNSSSGVSSSSNNNNNTTPVTGGVSAAAQSGNGTASPTDTTTVAPVFDPEICKEIFYNLHSFMRCLDQQLKDKINQNKTNPNQTLVNEFIEMHKCFNQVSVDASTNVKGANDKEFKEEIDECLKLNGHGGGIGSVQESPNPLGSADNSSTESRSEVLVTSKIAAILFPVLCWFGNRI